MACEAYYTEDELVDGNCPIHGRRSSVVKEENYFFRLSRYEQRLLDWYDAHPDAVMPRQPAQRGARLHPQGLQRHLDQPHAVHWGVPCRGTRTHVSYVWFDALPNYITAAGYGADDPSEFEHWWPADVHLIGKDIIRFHCVYWPAMLLAAGMEPPRQVARPRLAAGGRREDVQDQAQPDRPGDLVDDFGVDAFRYHFLRDTPFGPDGDFSYEGMVARYNADLANNLGNLLSRVATVVGSKCGGVGPAPRPAARCAAAADAAYQDAAAAWDRLAPSEALDATGG